MIIRKTFPPSTLLAQIVRWLTFGINICDDYIERHQQEHQRTSADSKSENVNIIPNSSSGHAIFTYYPETYIAARERRISKQSSRCQVKNAVAKLRAQLPIIRDNAHMHMHTPWLLRAKRVTSPNFVTLQLFLANYTPFAGTG